MVTFFGFIVPDQSRAAVSVIAGSPVITLYIHRDFIMLVEVAIVFHVVRVAGVATLGTVVGDYC